MKILFRWAEEAAAAAVVIEPFYERPILLYPIGDFLLLLPSFASHE